MKYFLILNIFISLWSQFNRIAVTNELKAEAEKAYSSKDYKRSAELYQRMMNTYSMDDEDVRLNLAHSYYLSDERKKAAAVYEQLTSSSNYKTRSVAYQQLGVMTALRGKYEAALVSFKQALKIDPDNEKARYNYELVKKIYDMDQSLNQARMNKDPKGRDKDQGESETGEQKKKEALLKHLNASGKNTTNYSQGDGSIRDERSNGETEAQGKSQESSPEENEKELDASKKGNKEKEALKVKRLHEAKISEEKARMILEVLKNEEIQYLQERKRNETNNDYKNKPDW